MPKIVGPLKKCECCGELFEDKSEGGRAVVCLNCYRSIWLSEPPELCGNCETCRKEACENRVASYDPDKED